MTKPDTFIGQTIKQKCRCNGHSPTPFVVIEEDAEWTAVRVECKSCGSKIFAPIPGSIGDQAQKLEWQETKGDETFGSLDNCPQD